MAVQNRRTYKKQQQQKQQSNRNNNNKEKVQKKREEEEEEAEQQQKQNGCTTAAIGFDVIGLRSQQQQQPRDTVRSVVDCRCQWAGLQSAHTGAHQ